MSRKAVFFLTLLAMIAFAANSLLCRFALKNAEMDAASFTLIRVVSGAVVLWLVVRVRGGASRLAGPTARAKDNLGAGNWPSAFALFAYAACFSYAYISLSVATGALLLFGAVQTTMIGYGLWRSERLSLRQSMGLLCALVGLVVLLLPGLSAPSFRGALLMLTAGVAWGIYSLRGKSKRKSNGDATSTTAGNFLRAVPFAVVLSMATLPWSSLDHGGIAYAIASGALASGLGYAIWYSALRELTTTSAATVQLSVPVIAAVGGMVFLNEPMTWRLLMAAVAILGGIAFVIIPGQAASK